MKHFLYISLLLAGLLCAVGCIEDGFSTSASDQPTFSVDTLKMGTVFTDEATPTKRLLIHNRHNKSLLLSDVRIGGRDAECFRINVDGQSSSSFTAVEVRSRDSIFVLVEATLPEREGVVNEYEATLDVTTNGVRQSLPIVATGQNVVRLNGVTLEQNTVFTADKPYQIYDSLVVAPGAKLTLEPGTRLCFHDKSMLIVRGTLRSNGTPELPVVLGGDRTGNVVGDISFEIMSRQWVGVFFTMTSMNNVLTNTTIQNTWQAVMVTGNPARPALMPQLTLKNCRLRNSADIVLETYHSNILAVGCEFAEGSQGLVYCQGGDVRFNHCTFANNYLFTAIGGAAVQLAHLSADDSDSIESRVENPLSRAGGLDDGSGYPYLKADFSNCIIYGIGADISHSDLSGTGVTFRRCLFRSAGSDDDNFIECLWEEDPLYYTVRNEYIFDYRLRPESPAIGAADPALTLAQAASDAYGLTRGDAPDLGAYVFNENPLSIE